MDLLWNFLENIELTIDTSNILPNLNCALCSTVMKKSMVTTCGCSFCDKCIKAYLGEDTKPCPACVKVNIVNELSYSDNLWECRKSNKEIARSVVKCPQSECEFSCEMQSLLEHLMSCQIRNEACIMKSMGCTSASMNGKMIEKHLQEDLKLHFQLVADNFVVLRNWMDSLQVDRTENAEMCNEFAQMRADNNTMTLRMNEVTAVTQSAVAEIGALRTANTQLQEIVQENKNEIAQMKSNDDMRKKEICSLKAENENIKQTNATLKTNISQIVERNKEQFCSLRSENVEMKQTIGGLNSTIGDMRRVMESIETETESPIEKMSTEISKLKKAREIRKKAVTDIKDEAGATAEGLHWTVTQLSQLHYQKTWSEPFTISGYSMSVQMRCNPNNIETDLYLLQSVGDTGVAWPMRLCLRLKLVDPDSGAQIQSREIQCNQTRPQKEKIRIGGTDWVDFAGQDGVTRTDSVLISVDLS